MDPASAVQSANRRLLRNAMECGDALIGPQNQQMILSHT
jgi:hypothetical protein